MNKKICFITGGARSGKSTFAEKRANDSAGKRAYIATAQALDAEMAARIEKHKKDRGGIWDTFEEPLAVAELLKKLNGKYDIVLLDCLTLWLSNVMARTKNNEAIIARFDALLKAITIFNGVSIIVSNEVGLGIVPNNQLARKFQDLAGILNQKMAEAANEVYFIVSGIPVRLK
jgi:adenosylcobinamide kinase/adenosylcobinamide-phosphate guanylyltransferase